LGTYIHIFLELPKINNGPNGKNSSFLVTLEANPSLPNGHQLKPGLPDFSRYNIPKRGENTPNDNKITKCS
jgi:hypothetical protein